MTWSLRASRYNQLYFTLETMEEQLKERLVGASVLVALGVTFIPMFLHVPAISESGVLGADVQAYPHGDISLDPPSPPSGGDVSDPGQPTKSTADSSPSAEQPAGAAPTEVPRQSADPTPGSEPTPANQLVDTLIPSVVALQTPSTLAPPMLPDSQQAGVTGWAIQLGSFSSQENAALLENRLRKLGYKAFVETLYIADNKVFRVRVGPEVMESTAKELQAKLEKDIDLKGLVVRFP